MNPLMMLGATLLAGFGALSVVYFRSSSRALSAYLRGLRALDPADIPAMARECVSEYRTRLQLQLDIQDLESSARSLDAALCSLRAVLALSSAERRLGAAELSGAFLGELIRRHTGAVWTHDGEQPVLSVRTSEGDEPVWPFIDTVNHIRAGRGGELYSMTMSLVERSRDASRAGMP